MGAEKESSKSGGYVGGFFQLFDWTAKSRKKLFSSKSDLSEHPKQGKRSDGNLPTTRLYVMDEGETGAGTSIRGSSDYSCASSVTDDDGCGARAPGVVARLMGLDSLPTSSTSLPNSAQIFDTWSLKDASNCRKHFDNCDSQIMCPGNVLNRDGPPRNTKPQKVLSRPVEKFQTEILPPKSAKSIPITRHKLLSPIKSPGFIPSKTAAHIMEAAAKIIEASPQAAVKAKMPIIGSSSVPLKVRDLEEKLDAAQKASAKTFLGPLKDRDLKEKVEAAHKTSRLPEVSTRKTVESNVAKCLEGQSLNKSWNGSVEAWSFRAFPETEGCSSGIKKKGKSISLAIQAKVNVQRREGLSSSNSQGLVVQKEQSEVPSTQPFKSQPNAQKTLHRRSSTNSTSGVLRQNNQKQNCLMDKDKSASKHLVSNLQSRRVLSGNPSPLRHKTSGKTVGPKIGSRKLGLNVTESEKGISNSNTRNIPRKKRSIEGNLQLKKIQVLENTMIQNGPKATESNPLTEKHFSWAEESKRKGMDVVSFTFTAPLTRSMAGSGASSHVGQQDIGVHTDFGGKRLLLDADSTKLSSVGYNVIGGDALSTLLEQKLRELTKSIESSCCNSVRVGSTSSSPPTLQHLVSTLNAGGMSRSPSKKDQNASFTDRSGSSYGSDVISLNSIAPRLKQVFQGVDDTEEYISQLSDSTKLLDCRRPSPISVLEPSCSTESCSSLDSTDSGGTEESKPCSSIHAQEAFGFSPSMNFHKIDAKLDLSDSASSASAGTVSRNNTNIIREADILKSTTDWEMAYIKKIFLNLELMFQDFAMGRTQEIISPRLFDQLEIYGFETDAVEARLERKVLFDCVSECLSLKCRHRVNGGYKTWMKGVTTLKRKEKLAEEVYKEVTLWRGMGDSMVDELVDKDMSCQYGRWLDFEVDAFVLAVEVEGQIFSSLVNEVIADVLWF